MNRIALQIGLVCVALAGLAACGDPDPIINIPDSGSTPDSGGGGPVDSGTVRVDSGPGPDTCPPGTAAAPSATLRGTCSPATLACFEAAMTQAAFDACIAGDPTNGMNCATCRSVDITATCSATGICDDEFGEVLCCVQEECASLPMAEQQACINREINTGGACATVFSMMNACINASAGATPPLCEFTDACNMAPPATFAPDFSRSARSSRSFHDLRAAVYRAVAR